MASMRRTIRRNVVWKRYKMRWNRQLHAYLKSIGYAK